MKLATRVKITDEIFAQCKEVMASKGVAYTIGSEDINRNFKEVARLIEGVPDGPVKVALIYYLKQVFSLISICKNLKDPEGLDSRVVDLINYTIIIRTLFDDDES